MIFIAGVVLSVGVATGLDLFLTLALTGVLAGLSPLPPFPGLATLAAPLLLIPSVAMVVVETFVERRIDADVLWRQLNAVIRPVGAMGLTALMLSGLPMRSITGAVLSAAVIAFVVQSARSGWAFLARVRGSTTALHRGLQIEHGVVFALVLLNWWSPWPALILSLTVLSAILVNALVLLPAFGLTLHLTLGRVRGFVRHGRWVAPRRFPTWIKARLAPAGVVTGGRLRATRTTCVGYAPRRFVRFGWLVVRGADPIFASRRGRIVETMKLTLLDDDAVSSGPMCLVARVATSEDGTVALVFSEDGPGPDQIRAELA